MKSLDRPTQITEILRALSLADSQKISAELAAYIADLEAKQPERPAQIAEILRTIASQYPVDIATALETYISTLESRQQAIAPNTAPPLVWDRNNPPVWSHQRSVERDQHRRERALKKQNNYR